MSGRRGPEGQEKAGAAASKEIDKLIDDPDMNSQVPVPTVKTMTAGYVTSSDASSASWSN